MALHFLYKRCGCGTIMPDRIGPCDSCLNRKRTELNAQRETFESLTKRMLSAKGQPHRGSENSPELQWDIPWYPRTEDSEGQIDPSPQVPQRLQILYGKRFGPMANTVSQLWTDTNPPWELVAKQLLSEVTGEPTRPTQAVELTTQLAEALKKSTEPTPYAKARATLAHNRWKTRPLNPVYNSRALEIMRVEADANKYYDPSWLGACKLLHQWLPEEPHKQQVEELMLAFYHNRYAQPHCNWVATLLAPRHDSAYPIVAKQLLAWYMGNDNHLEALTQKLRKACKASGNNVTHANKAYRIWKEQDFPMHPNKALLALRLEDTASEGNYTPHWLGAATLLFRWINHRVTNPT